MDESQETDSQSPFTQHDLLTRAADYFAAARKPRAEWKKLEDLAAQLAEFDLRCAAGDYDAAADLLSDFDGEYLFVWGHYRLMIEMHEKVQGKIQDKSAEIGSLNSLGSAYAYIGHIKRAIIFQEKGLQIARELTDRSAEGIFSGNLGNRYAALGEAAKAIQYFKQALVINQETGDKNGEGMQLNNLGGAYGFIGNTSEAINYYEQALVLFRELEDKSNEGTVLGNIAIIEFDSGDSQRSIEHLMMALKVARDFGNRSEECRHLINIGEALIDLIKYDEAISYFQQAQNIAEKAEYSGGLQYSIDGKALAYLFQDDLVNARATIEAALQYDVPENNHNASALHGIIALRQGEEVAARGAFVRAIGQADEILSKTAEYYSALDAKGLAICGLTICEFRLGRGAVPAPDDDGANTGRGDPAPTVGDAIETFRKARKIAPHAGVVKSVLRLFDELVKCDTEGILKDVRGAVEGK